ncbi:hypothetical protein HDU96_003573, partial [Phlyctochytrium bullatum]
MAKQGSWSGIRENLKLCRLEHTPAMITTLAEPRKLDQRQEQGDADDGIGDSGLCWEALDGGGCWSRQGRHHGPGRQASASQDVWDRGSGGCGGFDGWMPSESLGSATQQRGWEYGPLESAGGHWSWKTALETVLALSKRIVDEEGSPRY